MFDSAAEKRKKSMGPRQGAMQQAGGSGTAASSASSTSSQQGERTDIELANPIIRVIINEYIFYSYSSVRHEIAHGTWHFPLCWCTWSRETGWLNRICHGLPNKIIDLSTPLFTSTISNPMPLWMAPPRDPKVRIGGSKVVRTRWSNASNSPEREKRWETKSDEYREGVDREISSTFFPSSQYAPHCSLSRSS